MAKTIVYNSDVLDREFTYEIPFKITCNATGLVKTYTLESYINRKIDRFGGLEKLHKKYICKDANRLLKEGKTIQEVIEALVPPVTPTTPPVEEVKEEPVMETMEVPIEEVIEQEIIQEIETPVMEEQFDRPVAKKDANGKYRNSRGHIVKAELLEKYILLED